MILLNARTSPSRDYTGNMADDMIVSENEALTVTVGLLAAHHAGLITEREWAEECVEILTRAVPTQRVQDTLADMLLVAVTA